MAGSLRNQEDAGAHEDEEYARSGKTSEAEAPVGGGLIEQVADGCPQWTGKNERRPEQQGARYVVAATLITQKPNVTAGTLLSVSRSTLVIGLRPLRYAFANRIG
jgi:hypothetical protein